LYPAGFYDLRDAAPVPVVSTAFRPKDADELGRNPFRVFTPMLTTDDNKFLGIDLRPRVQWFLAERELFDRALIAEARRMAADGGAPLGVLSGSLMRPWRRSRYVTSRSKKLGTTNWR
jgi:uncharacterized glyoxalase superfamily metalloenzyme YdcJ